MLPDVHGIKRIKAPDLQAPPPKEDVCRCMLGLEINMCFISIRKEIMSNTSRTCCCMPLSLLCPCFLYCQVFCGFGAALSWKDMRLLSLLVLPGPHVCCLGPLFFFFLKLSAYSFHFSALPGHEEDVCLHCFFLVPQVWKITENHAQLLVCYLPCVEKLTCVSDGKQRVSV
jgi:hypothetical protein